MMKVLLPCIFLIAFASVANARVTPPTGDGRSFGAEYDEVFGATCVYAKVGKICFSYAHSGKKESPQPAPGFVRVDDNDSNNPGETVTVYCEGREIDKQKGPYLRLSVETLVAMAKAKHAAVFLQTTNREIRENLTPEDQANLKKLLQNGADWKPPADLLRLHGELTYAIAAGPNMLRWWDRIKPLLVEAVNNRTNDEDRTLLMFLDDRVWLRPRNHVSSKAEHRKEVVSALETIPTEAKLDFSSDLALKIAEQSHYRNVSTLLLIVADPVPEEFADALVGHIAKYGVRVHALWCGADAPDEQTKRSLDRVTKATAGLVRRVEEQQ